MTTSLPYQTRYSTLLIHPSLTPLFKIKINRTPRPFPTLSILKKSAVQEMIASCSFTKDEIVDTAVMELEQFEMVDFDVRDYNPHAKISMKMSV